MSELHRLAGQLALALAVVMLAWSLVLLALRGEPGRLFAANLVWLGLAIVASAGIGALMLLAGGSPREGLHLLYGVLAVGALPATLLLVEGRPPRQRSAILAIAGLVLVILLLRLFETGR